MAVTKNQTVLAIEAATRMGLALLEAIVGLGSIPSGHLYARVMGSVSLNTYDAIIGGLISGGLLTKDGQHVLTPTQRGRDLIASGAAS